MTNNSIDMSDDTLVVKTDDGENTILRSAAVDLTGNYIAVGHKCDTVSNDEALIVKFDLEGDLLWEKKLGGSGDEYFHSVAVDSSGNYITVGYEYSSVGNYEALIAKFDTNGTVIWQKRLSSSDYGYFYSVAVDPTGNYIAVGYEHSTVSNPEALIVKFDTNGTVIWQKRLSSSDYSYFNSVAIDLSGDYIAVGYERSSLSNNEALIAKFDTNGNLLWRYKLNGRGSDDHFYSVAVDSSGNYIAVGGEGSGASNDSGLIAKFDNNGDLIWQKRLGSGVGADVFYSIAVDLSGNYMVTGYGKSGVFGNLDGSLIAKFESDGNLIWQKRLDGSKENYLYSIVVDLIGNYLAVGYERTGNNTYKALVTGLYYSGEPLWQKKLGGSDNDYFYSVAVDSAGNYIAVGNDQSSTTGNNGEALMTKFSPTGYVLWQKRLSGDSGCYLFSVTVDLSGNYIVVGHVAIVDDNYKAIVTKFDSGGELLWQKKLDCEGNDSGFLYTVAVDSSGNYIAVGQEDTNAANADALIFKFDGTGNLLWQKRLSGIKSNFFRSVVVDQSGNYIITGYEFDDPIKAKGLIAKFSPTGDLIWLKKLVGDERNYLDSVVVDSSGNYIAVGYEYSNTFYNNYESLITKFDTNGNLLWRNRLSGGGYDSFQSIAMDSSGNYIAVGCGSGDPGSRHEALIAKFDTNGNLLWRKRLIGGYTGYFYSVAVDSSDNYIAVGYEYINDINNKALMAKFDSNGVIVTDFLSSNPNLTLNDSSLALISP